MSVEKQLKELLSVVGDKYEAEFSEGDKRRARFSKAIAEMRNEYSNLMMVLDSVEGSERTDLLMEVKKVVAFIKQYNEGKTINSALEKGASHLRNKIEELQSY
jgi:hypothetical protein